MQVYNKEENIELYLYVKSAISISRSYQITITKDSVHASTRDTFVSFRLSSSINIPDPGQYLVTFPSLYRMTLRPALFVEHHGPDEALPSGDGWKIAEIPAMPRGAMQVEICRSNFIYLIA